MMSQIPIASGISFIIVQHLQYLLGEKMNVHLFVKIERERTLVRRAVQVSSAHKIRWVEG
jgi:hypothetical protein